MKKLFTIFIAATSALLLTKGQLEGHMSDSNSVEIVCILDRSGSMESIIEDAIGGFNSFLEDQQKLPGIANLTVVFFDSEKPFDIWCESTPVADVQKLTREIYNPGAMTPLLDAIGKTIESSKVRLEKDCKKDQKVIVVVMTDGLENYSKEFTRKQIFDKISEQEKDHNWEFVFLAANQDAIVEGKKLGFASGRSVNFASTAAGTQRAYQTVNTAVSSYRSGADIDSAMAGLKKNKDGEVPPNK